MQCSTRGRTSRSVAFGDGIAGRHYEICTRAGDVGRVLACSSHSTAPSSDGAARCHERFWLRATPCVNCPFFPPPPTDDRRVRSAIVGTISGEPVLVIGRRTGAHRVRIAEHRMSAQLVDQLVDWRIAILGREAKLSPRESEVFRLLVVGRSLDDIAGELGVVVRTAKYHQGNVLTKLGATSRNDLVRILTSTTHRLPRRGPDASR
jgi:DNA-binding CsgD family transcriptional regulator